MEIPGISASDTLSLDRSKSSNDVDKGTFMRLLVEQLSHQDPLSPTKNEDFIAQLATFTSVEELEDLNDSMVAMIALNQSNALLSQMTQSSALIGKTIAWQDPISGESHEGMVNSVRIQDGVALLRVGEQDVPLVVVSEILDGGMRMSDESEEMMDGDSEGDSSSDSE